MFKKIFSILSIFLFLSSISIAKDKIDDTIDKTTDFFKSITKKSLNKSFQVSDHHGKENYNKITSDNLDYKKFYPNIDISKEICDLINQNLKDIYKKLNVFKQKFI